MLNPWEVKGKTFLEKLGGLHWFWIGILLCVMVLIPTLRPLGLPISTTQWTVDAYNAIKNAPSDKVVIWEDLWGLSATAAAEAAHTAVMRILFANNKPFIMYGEAIDTPQLQQYITEKVLKTAEAQGKVYGKDWIQLGFIAGGEAAIVSVAEDIRGAFKTDYFGTPLDQLPLMAKIKDYKDVGLVITSFGSTTWIESSVRQWYIKYNLPIVSYTMTGGATVSVAYYPNKGVVGIIEGGRGGAELEFLGKVYGIAQSQTDAKTLSFVAVAVMIIVGNISYFGTRGKKNNG
jgi:hypothetical protein